MQLKKQHWKRIRGVMPCVVCGGDHPSIECVIRTGRRPRRRPVNRRERE